jgi:hypothetical protein
MSRRARSVHATLGALLLAQLVSARAAHALPPEPRAAALAPCGAGEDPLEIVMLPPPSPASLAPDAAIPRSLRDAVCDWFRDDRWSVSFSQRAALPEPSARGLRLSLELRVDLARLHIDTTSGRSVHDVPLGSGLDDAGVEAVAEALHSAIQATSVELHPGSEAAPSASSSSERANALVGETRSPRRVSTDVEEGHEVLATPARAPAPEPPSASPTVPRVSTAAARDEAAPDSGSNGVRASKPGTRGRQFPVHTALGYQAYARGAEPFMHGPALHVELDALSRAVTLAGYFRAAAFTSGTRRSGGFAVGSSGVSLSLGAAASLPVGGVSLRAAASSGVDLVALDVRVIEPTLVRSVPDRHVAPRPFSGLEAGVRYGLGSFELAVDALVRWLWVDTPYQVRDGERTLTVFQPWQLQPGAVLELGCIW